MVEERELTTEITEGTEIYQEYDWAAWRSAVAGRAIGVSSSEC